MPYDEEDKPMAQDDDLAAFTAVLRRFILNNGLTTTEMLFKETAYSIKEWAENPRSGR